MNTAKLKLAARGLAAVAFGMAGIYAAECLECWQPHGVMLSVGCVALVLASMYLAISGSLVLSRLVRRREEQEQEEQPPPDPHFEAALDSRSWAASLHGICILALIPIGIFQLLRSTSAYLPMSFLGGILLISGAREFWPKLIDCWRAVVGGSSLRDTRRRLLAALSVSIVMTAMICVLISELISQQPVIGLVSAIIGLVGTTCAAFLAGHTDKNAQQAVAADRPKTGAG